MLRGTVSEKLTYISDGLFKLNLYCICDDEGSTLSQNHQRETSMSRLKAETLSIRTSSEIKQLLRIAAERERRSVASMIEILILEYAQTHDLKLDHHSDEEAMR